jgi:hypothetical protein
MGMRLFKRHTGRARNSLSRCANCLFSRADSRMSNDVILSFDRTGREARAKKDCQSSRPSVRVHGLPGAQPFQATRGRDFRERTRLRF